MCLFLSTESLLLYHSVNERIDLLYESLDCAQPALNIHWISPMKSTHYLVKVQREALAESSVVFGNKMGRRLTVVEEGLFSGIATSTVQVSYTRYRFTCSQ